MRQDFQNLVDARRNCPLFFYQLTKRSKELLHCHSTTILGVSQGNWFRKLWKDQNVSKKLFYPDNCCYVLVVVSIKDVLLVSIKEGNIGVIDPQS